VAIVNPDNPSRVETFDLTLFEVRDSTKQQRIRTCAVDVDLLKRLLRTLRTAGDKAADIETAALAANDRVDELVKARARNAVAITVIGANGERFHALDDERRLDQTELPQPLRSVTFDTGALYRRAGKTPPNSVIVHFDFSKPPLLDLSNPSGQPTPNQSFLNASGSDAHWVAGTYSGLVELLDQRRTEWGWLHGPGTYDALLFTVGIPVALSAGALVDWAVSSNATHLPVALRTAFLIYALFAGLFLFRLAFGVVRWLFPYVEMQTEPRSRSKRWRTALLTILFGALGSLLAAAFLHVF
jgi:hypothetical protein